jgi:hypothetical protein
MVIVGNPNPFSQKIDPHQALRGETLPFRSHFTHIFTPIALRCFYPHFYPRGPKPLLPFGVGENGVRGFTFPTPQPQPHSPQPQRVKG